MTEVRWLVAFSNVDGRSPVAHWLLGWFRSGFRHCYAFRGVEPSPLLPAGGVLVCQLATARLDSNFFPGDTEAAWLARAAAAGETVVEARALVDDSRWVVRGMTCVSVTRGLLAMPTRWQTPYGLARELSRRRL